MKKNLWIVGLTALLSLIFLACPPVAGKVDTNIGADDAAEITLITTGNTGLASVALPGTPLALTAVSGDLTPHALPPRLTLDPVVRQAAGQVVSLDFSYVVDEESLDGIQFHILGNGNATTDTASTRTSRITPTSIRVERVAGNGCRVFYTLNLASANQYIELYINAAVLTGKKTLKLDLDGDGIMGELEDDYIGYIEVNQSVAPGSTPPTAVTLVERLPRANPGYTPSVTLASGVIDLATYNGVSFASKLGFLTSDTGGSANQGKISVANAFKVYKDINGVWTEVVATPAYSGSPDFQATISLTTAPAVGETYKITVDRYNVLETAEVNGYTHRLSYNQNNVPNGVPPGLPGTPPPTPLAPMGGSRYTNYYVTFGRAGSVQQAVTVAKAGEANEFYVDVTVDPLLSPINLSTVTASSFKVRLAQNTRIGINTTGQYRLAQTAYYADYTTPIAISTTDWQEVDSAVYAFRIYLPRDVCLLVTGGVNYIEIAPSVLSLETTNDPKDNTGLRSFGQFDGTDGWRRIAF